MKKILILSFFLLAVTTGCQKDATEETPEIKAKNIPLLAIERTSVTPTLTISGTLQPKFQSLVAAEVSGVIREIYASEGDIVRAGEPLLQFFEDTNLLHVDLRGAQIALSDANRALELTRKQAEQNQESARIAVVQAEENLSNAKRTDNSTGSSVEAQVGAAESSVELAKINLDNAKKTIDETKENLNKREQDILENKENVISNAMSTYRSVLQSADEIMGVNIETRKENDRFEVYLGFKDPQTKIDSENLFRTLWNTFETLEKQHISDPKSVSPEDILGLSDDIRTTLQSIDVMLKKTISGGNFTDAELSSFRTSIAASRSTVEGTISSVTAIIQQEKDFYINKPQQIRNAELALQQAEEQLTQSEKNLEQIKSGGDVSKVGTENQISIAKNTLESASTQLSLTQKQNEISIQQATANRDSARNAYNKALIQSSKLNVIAPVNGVVIKKQVETGDTVAIGSPLFTIAQVDSLLLKGDIDIQDLPRVQLGMKATVTAEAFGKIEGVVSKIFPTADEVTRRVTIEISFQNTNRNIPANIFATATLSLPTEKEIFLIPQKALLSQDPPTVFIVGEGEQGNETTYMTEKRSVTLGKRYGNDIEITEGLTEGELIVPEPVLSLKEGDVIALPTTTEKIESEENL